MYYGKGLLIQLKTEKQQNTPNKIMVQENNNNEIDLRRVFAICLQHWYWFVTGVLLFSALGVLHFLRTNPSFKTQATIMLRQSNELQGIGVGGAAMDLLGVSMNAAADDEVEVLTSRDLMYQVVDALDLWQECRYKDGLKWKGEFGSRTFRVDTVALTAKARQSGFRVKVSRARGDKYKVAVKVGRFGRSSCKVEDLSAPIETCAGTILIVQNKPWNEKASAYRVSYPGNKGVVVDVYQKKVQIALRKKESNLIDLTTTSDMPKRDEALLGKIIELYNLNTLVDKNIMAQNTAAFIDERLAIVSAELSDAEDAVADYKSANELTDLSEEARLFLEMNTAEQKELARVETQLNLVDYIDDLLRDETKRFSLLPANLGIEDASLTAFISEYNNMLLQRMRVLRTATDQNPVVEQMNDQLLSMRQNIIASVASVRESLSITRAGLTERGSEFASRIKTVPAQERQYVQIKRQQVLKEEIYLYLYQKREENALMLATTATPVRVIDKPKMDTLSGSPKLQMICLICLVLGLGFPAALLYLKMLLDDKFHDAKEYEKMVNAPFVGQIVENSRGVCVAIREGENTVSAELFRQLRTNLRFMLPSDIKTPVVLVSSCINGEGKSYVAINLALSLAILGKKVALVGLDVRKPTLAEKLQMANKGCLTSYLSDTSYSVDDTIVHKVEHENLDVIPCGVVPPNPSELLQNERLDDLFAQLRARYDYIIVDTAPLAMVSDTFLLDRMSDMTLLVSRADYTPIEMKDFINQLVESKQMRNVACVLNAVEQTTTGYGYGYRVPKKA